MAHRLTWVDRLRIERVVWMLDQRLYDIPRESRIAHRREVRQNLLSAAQERQPQRLRRQPPRQRLRRLDAHETSRLGRPERSSMTTLGGAARALAGGGPGNNDRFAH